MQLTGRQGDVSQALTEHPVSFLQLREIHLPDIHRPEGGQRLQGAPEAPPEEWSPTVNPVQPDVYQGRGPAKSARLLFIYYRAS